MLVRDEVESTSKAETPTVVVGAVRELDPVCTGLVTTWWHVSRCPVPSLEHYERCLVSIVVLSL